MYSTFSASSNLLKKIFFNADSFLKQWSNIFASFPSPLLFCFIRYFGYIAPVETLHIFILLFLAEKMHVIFIPQLAEIREQSKDLLDIVIYFVYFWSCLMD